MSLIVCQSQPSSTGDLGDGAAVAADLLGHPPPGPISHRQPRRRRWPDRPRSTTQSGTPATGTNQRCLRHTSRAGRPKHGRSTSSTTGRSFTHATVPQSRHAGRARGRLDVHPDRLAGLVFDAEDLHDGQADEQHAQARRVRSPQGLSGSDRCRNRQILRAPVPRPWTPTPRSDPKRRQT